MKIPGKIGACLYQAVPETSKSFVASEDQYQLNNPSN